MVHTHIHLSLILWNKENKREKVQSPPNPSWMSDWYILVFYARKSQACQWKEMPINGSSQHLNPCFKKKILPWRICLKWRLPGPTPGNQFSKQGLITCILRNFHGKSDTSAARPHLKRSLERSTLWVASGISTIRLCKG